MKFDGVNAQLAKPCISSKWSQHNRKSQIRRRRAPASKKPQHNHHLPASTSSFRHRSPLPTWTSPAKQRFLRVSEQLASLSLSLSGTASLSHWQRSDFEIVVESQNKSMEAGNQGFFTCGPAHPTDQKSLPALSQLRSKPQSPAETMEDSYSVCSPRRIINVSKKRKATVNINVDNTKASGNHGPKHDEVYGFVGAITTVVASVIFLVWAYVPESWLHSIGIFYYPSRYWALAVPAYVLMAVVLALGFYCGLNFMSTPSPSSLHIIYDEFSRDPLSFPPIGGDDQPIEPISDISIARINDCMFMPHEANFGQYD